MESTYPEEDSSIGHHIQTTVDAAAEMEDNLIHDYDAIERLKNYTFKLRTADPTVIQRYPASKTTVDAVKARSV